MSISTENFVKAIYKQGRKYGTNTKLSTLSDILGVSNAATTDMAKNLALKGLVIYNKYKPLSLTQKGTALALSVIRKHRLWETFLYKTLNLSLHEIHAEAEHLEHSTSNFLANKIDNFLGNPGFDPHGDPIPSIDGNINAKHSKITLSEAKPGVSYEISRLFSSDKDFFDFCSENNLTVGTKIWLEKRYSFNNTTSIKVDKNTILLTEEFSNIIYVK